MLGVQALSRHSTAPDGAAEGFGTLCACSSTAILLFLVVLIPLLSALLQSLNTNAFFYCQDCQREALDFVASFPLSSGLARKDQRRSFSFPFISHRNSQHHMGICLLQRAYAGTLFWHTHELHARWLDSTRLPNQSRTQQAPDKLNMAGSRSGRPSSPAAPPGVLWPGPRELAGQQGWLWLPGAAARPGSQPASPTAPVAASARQATAGPVPGALGETPSSRYPRRGWEGWGERRRLSPASSWPWGMWLVPSDRTMPKAITHLPEAEECHM